jgi:exopolyphosphatase / guanosine-5'-triphosphate,3'-diphosphate pyrophosphatase
METVAAIDVGTNSLHLVVARVADDGSFEVVASEKEMVRLGEGGGDMKRLSPEAVDRGIAALSRFRQIADIDGARIRCVATSAVREAENPAEFVDRARLEAGVEVEVISGTEEARLIHLGVLQAVPVFDQRLLLCDIGGGSTELLVGHKGEPLASRSFKLGAVRLTNRFFPGDRTHPGAVSACRAFLRSALQPFAREVEARGYEVAVGSSGTIESIAAMIHATTGEAAPRTYNRFTFTADQLAAAVKALTSAKSVNQRGKIPGVDPRRADIILAGSLILEAVFEVLDVPQMTISANALREGVLLDTIQRLKGGSSLHHLRDISRRSVRLLAELMDEEPEHSAHVARLAVSLFDQTQVLHGLDETHREYLEAGALLANVGLFVSHSKHHLHSYYLIRNTERLAGFTDTEIEIIALLARYHRKSAPKPAHAEYAALPAQDQVVVKVLAGILRVAIGLDRSHEARVRALRVTRKGRGLVVTAVAEEGVGLELELYAATERKGLLEDALGVPVEIVAG